MKKVYFTTTVDFELFELLTYSTASDEEIDNHSHISNLTIMPESALSGYINIE